MLSLNTKLFRDVRRLRGQIIAVGLVIGSGVAVLVMSLTTVEALTESSEAYYERYRFADVFATVVRAPKRAAERIAALPGVQMIETSVSHFAVVRVADFREPIIGQLTSVPEGGQSLLNRLVLRSGRFVAANRHDEVVLHESFANAHSLKLGDSVEAIVNGRQRTLVVVGTALSPEFIYSLAPGSLLPDDKRFGVIWMGEEAMAAAFDLDGAFNSLALTLSANVPADQLLHQIDDLLEDYGGTGAIARKDQISNWFVKNEIAQLKTMSTILPVIFLLVAAFLTNMVLGRLIAIERSEIGLLKAFGYSGASIGWHYVKLVAVMTFLGVICGSLIGLLLGRYNTQLYAELFHFPLLIYRPGLAVFVLGGLVSLLAATVGAVTAVYTAVRLPPAEAMRPPEPPAYRRSRLARFGVGGWIDQPTRISLRQIGRWPLRATMTGTGIALSIGLLVMAMQWGDSVDHIADVYFFHAQRQNVTVGFTEAKSTTVAQDIKNFPGVLMVEPQRFVAAKFTAGHRSHRGAMMGTVDESILRPIYDDGDEKFVAMPTTGLAVSARLAKKLSVGPGDYLSVEILEQNRSVQSLPIAKVFETSIGLPVYIALDELNRLLDQRPSANSLQIVVDENRMAEFFAAMQTVPQVSSVVLRKAMIDAFYDTLAKNLLVFTSIFTFLATVLCFGVAYNSARISLSERGRELATLRVLGFTRREISYILLGEIGFIVLLALPAGALSGAILVWVIAQAFDTELFRLPLVISPSTYGWSIIIALLSSAFSAALVRRRVDKLDLIAVLKTRE